MDETIQRSFVRVASALHTRSPLGTCSWVIDGSSEINRVPCQRGGSGILYCILIKDGIQFNILAAGARPSVRKVAEQSFPVQLKAQNRK